jgi:hypothetical protein
VRPRGTPSFTRRLLGLRLPFGFSHHVALPLHLVRGAQGRPPTGAKLPAVLRRHERQDTSAYELITTRELVDVESERVRRREGSE